MFAADAGRPLFERFKGDLSTALDWLDKNKGRVDAIARTVGERLVAGWERVKGILGWVVDNHETLLATAKGIAALWVGKKALNVAHGAAGFLGNIAAARGAGGNAGGVASLLGYDPRIVSAAMKGVTTWGGKAASMFKYMRRTRVSAALMSLSAASDRAAAAVVAFAGKNGIGALTTAWKGMMVGAAGAAGYGFGTWMRSWEGFGKDRSIGEDLDAVFGWFGDLYNAKEHAERDARRHAHHLRLMEGQREEKAEARAKAQKPQAKASDRTTINVAKLEINVDAQRHEDPDRFAFDLTKHIADALAGSATSAPRPSVVPAY